MQYSQTHSLFCFPYSSGKGEKYQASISYLPNWILSTYFILVIFRRHKNQTNKTGALINLCCILESYSLFNLFSAVENFMCWSLKSRPRGFAWQKGFASNFAHSTIFGIKYIKPHWFLEIHWQKFWELSIIKAAKGPFLTSCNIKNYRSWEAHSS